ncbi:MAG: class I SAM-dependent methyltransferase [Deltaproteobacteria bacterium]
MSRFEWDTRYPTGDRVPERDPSRLLLDFSYMLPKGRALDIACGEGRNAVYLARQGYQVDAIDISEVAIKNARMTAKGLDINFIVADLENFSIPEDTYDLIINFYYLQRSLLPKIKKGLKKNGLVLFETYTIEHQAFGHPKNPEFLLKPNELLTLFNDLHIVYYREGVIEVDGKKAIASLVGRKI